MLRRDLEVSLVRIKVQADQVRAQAMSSGPTPHMARTSSGEGDGLQMVKRSRLLTMQEIMDELQPLLDQVASRGPMPGPRVRSRV